MHMRQLPGHLVAIDITKAFHTVSKKYILDSFRLYKFGPDVSRWVHTLLLQAQLRKHFGRIPEALNVQRVGHPATMSAHFHH